MLSDPWFNEHVCEILQEIAGVSVAWFIGKRILDAGCGGGRWSVGFLRLGAQVTAVDFSEAALERTRAVCTGLGHLEAMQVNLLNLPLELRDRRFDMVYSFGVLHHTGDTLKALRNVANLVSEQGLLVLYLYGSRSWGFGHKLRTNWVRLRLAPLSFDQKIEVLRRMYPDRDPHQCFDLLSPTINDRLTFDRVRSELEQLGFVDVVQTIRSTEIYVRARRPGFRELHHLRPTPISNSLFISHYEDVNRIRRDKAYEQRFWELAAHVLVKNGATPSIERTCERLKLSADTLPGQQVLVICPDSVTPALDLITAGARVTCLTPSEQWVGRSRSEIKILSASTMDEPAASEPQYHVILALASALTMSRRPEVVIKRLAARLVPGGLLIIETLLPEPETTAHKVRRLMLKPYPFEKKIERLLRRHPKNGLAGAFALLSSHLPLRLSEASLQKMLRQAGFQDVAFTSDGIHLLVHARSSARAAQQSN